MSEEEQETEAEIESPLDSIPKEEVADYIQVIDLEYSRQRVLNERAKGEEIQQTIITSAIANRPCIFMAPRIIHEKGEWYCAFGDLIGSGPSPDQAMEDFDYIYINGKSQIPKRATDE